MIDLFEIWPSSLLYTIVASGIVEAPPRNLRFDRKSTPTIDIYYYYYFAFPFIFSNNDSGRISKEWLN